MGIGECLQLIFYNTSLKHPPVVVVLYYDHALTFGEEYERIWANPTRIASVLFILNRYFSFFVRR